VSNPPGVHCENCRFAAEIPRETVMVICRRYPPQVIVKTEADERDTYHRVEDRWPEVGRDDWCGEWQPKEGPS
jgi:hypothetical protein